MYEGKADFWVRLFLGAGAVFCGVWLVVMWSYSFWYLFQTD
jgi:hypothetical protein